MPQQRTLNLQKYRFDTSNKKEMFEVPSIRGTFVSLSTSTIDQDCSRGHPGAADSTKCDIFYPLDKKTRQIFKTKEGKTPTAHQWEVYDFVCLVPAGKVTTYKEICSAIGAGSPRSVGTALRNNPFAPFVPCHRVIASDGFIGGFFGEWEKGGKKGVQMQRKISILASEGVNFDHKGYLVEEDKIWRPASNVTI